VVDVHRVASGNRGIVALAVPASLLLRACATH
jgi:hypothetical protein